MSLKKFYNAAIQNVKEKLRDFKKAFEDKLEGSIDNDAVGYYEAAYDMPLCNHSGAADENVGFSVGIMSDGTPFEADYWKYDKTSCVSVVMPEKNEFSSNKERIPAAAKVSKEPIPLHGRREIPYYSLLSIGMVDNGEEDDMDVVQKYLCYLADMGIVGFFTEVFNASLFYRVDEMGNDLVEIIIILSENGERYADTELNFRPFPGVHRLKLNSKKKGD